MIATTITDDLAYDYDDWHLVGSLSVVLPNGGVCDQSGTSGWQHDGSKV